MPKVILLCVNGSPADQAVLAAALAIGRSRGSHLIALHVRPDVQRDIATLAASDGGMATGIDTMIETMEKNADDREKVALNHWQAFLTANTIAASDQPPEKAPENGRLEKGPLEKDQNGMTGEWVSETGTETDWFAEYGRTSDLILVGRGPADDGQDLGLMEAALMDTGKPVMIVPRIAPAEPLTGTVGIAWNDTRESAGAVRAALPFLAAASQVVLFTIPADATVVDKSALRLVKTLRWHNPNVRLQTLLEHTRSAAEVLIDAAHQAKCGLLVMGGYGHTRLREAVFGGTTRTVLDDAPLPVLMVH